MGQRREISQVIPLPLAGIGIGARKSTWAANFCGFNDDDADDANCTAVCCYHRIMMDTPTYLSGAEVFLSFGGEQKKI